MQEIHLNKTESLLVFGIIVNPFKIGVFPSIVDREVIFYFSRVAKKFDKFKSMATVDTFDRVMPKSKCNKFTPRFINGFKAS